MRSSGTLLPGARGSPLLRPRDGAGGARASYWLPGLGAAAVLAAIAASAAWVYGVPGRGAASAFSLLFGAAFGILMQRGRFCFYCMFRDLIERRDPRPFYSLLAALAVGSVCYVVIFSAFLPTPTPGRLPPDAHIGPVSWALPAAGIAFGLGMTLSGACISGHLYRLGEGYTRAPFALAGAVIGFGAGFFSWRTLYLATISKAPVPWLPHALGYSGALAVQLAAIGLIALLLTRYLPGARAVPQAGPQSAAAATAPAAGNEPLSSDCSADPAAAGAGSGPFDPAAGVAVAGTRAVPTAVAGAFRLPRQRRPAGRAVAAHLCPALEPGDHRGGRRGAGRPGVLPAWHRSASRRNWAASPGRGSPTPASWPGGSTAWTLSGAASPWWSTPSATTACSSRPSLRRPSPWPSSAGGSNFPGSL